MSKSAEPHSRLTSQPCTLAEFEQLIELDENYDERLEWMAGVMYRRVPHWWASTMTGHLLAYMGNHIFERKMGYLLGAKLGYVIGGARLMPNLTFVTREHFDAMPEDGWMTPAPDFALETINPAEQDDSYIQQKLVAYHREKIPLLWLFLPALEKIDIYINGKFSHTAGIDDTLDGGDVLPGFTMPVAAIFQ